MNPAARCAVLLATFTVGCSSAAEPSGRQGADAPPSETPAEHDGPPDDYEPPEPDPSEYGSYGAIATTNDRLYWVGGNGNLARSFDPKDKSWALLPSLKVGRRHLGLAATKTQLIAVGGIEGLAGAHDDINRFDLDSGQWHEGPSLPEPLSAVTPIAVGDTVYFFGGNRVVDKRLKSYATESVTSVYALQADATTVVPRTQMPSPRQSVGLSVIDDEIWVLGGNVARADVDRSPPRTNIVEIYDPRADIWRTGPTMPKGAKARVVVVGGTLVVFDGSFPFSNAPQRLDLATSTWTLGTAQDDEQCGDELDGAVSIDGTIYLVGALIQGHGQPILTRICTYDPKTDRWARFDD